MAFNNVVALNGCSSCVQRKIKLTVFPELSVLHHPVTFSSVKHKDSALTAENTEHGLDVCISPVRHWAYNPINIFGLVKSDVFCYH